MVMAQPGRAPIATDSIVVVVVGGRREAVDLGVVAVVVVVAFCGCGCGCGCVAAGRLQSSPFIMQDFTPDNPTLTTPFPTPSLVIKHTSLRCASY